MFRCIPLFRGCNRQVECLDKRHCNLTQVHEDVFRYSRTLEEVLLDANHIRDLSRGFFRLIKIRKLSLSDNEIGCLPSDIGNLTSLVELDVSKNDIAEIPEHIKYLKSLQNADFSSNPLEKLPPGFIQLRNLTFLCLNDVSLYQLPNDFGSLTNLESLELRENHLKRLPQSFAFLVKLERLDMGSNEIEELPPLIGQLCSLQELWLDCNDLCSLPKEIGNLKKLTCLDVSENNLDILPEEISGLESLTDLHLSHNNLESLPDGIGNLHNLIIFKVDQNKLLVLHSSIGHCENLQELILTENLLSKVPASIGDLTKLTNLNLDCNRLVEIPAQIGNLNKLGVLSLRENCLSFLPPEMGKLKELHVLDVSGNRLQYLPVTITALNLKALWLSENQSQPMLKFQTDVDERTGAKVLTCFLLPQQECQTESIENLDHKGVDEDSHSSWEQQYENRITSVKFIGLDIDDEIEEKETQFVRHDTPHPKELKVRHTKLFVHKGKNIDGPIVAHDEKKEVVDSFRPQRSIGAALVSEVISVPDKKREQSKLTFEADRCSGIGEDNDLYEQSINLEQKEWTVSLKPINNFDSTDKPLELNGDVVDSCQKPLCHRTVDEESYDNDEHEEKPRREGERHVGFASDTEDQPERHTKLHRRDTPHHLKNKRISLPTSKEDQEKVASILAQALKGKESNEDETLPSPPPSPPQSCSSIQCNISLSGQEISNNGITSTEVVEEKIDILLERKSCGLGLSIAGGKGSTPYKGEDEGIFISRITQGGPAEEAGLKIGDKIILVGDTSITGIDHYEAVNVLKNSGDNIPLTVLREVNKESLIGPSGETDQPKSSLPCHVNAPSMNAQTVEDSVNMEDVLIQEPNKSASYNCKRQLTEEIIFTTLTKDASGVGIILESGFSNESFQENCGTIFIAKIVEHGIAAQDGKLEEGDKVLSINGIDLIDVTIEEAMALLNGSEKYIRIVVQREKVVAEATNSPNLTEKSPKLIGLLRPYTSYYSSGSYMANRPSYLGSYRRPQLSPGTNEKKPVYSIYTKLPGLRNDPSTTFTSSSLSCYTPTTSSVTLTTTTSSTFRKSCTQPVPSSYSTNPFSFQTNVPSLSSSPSLSNNTHQTSLPYNHSLQSSPESFVPSTFHSIQSKNNLSHKPINSFIQCTANNSSKSNNVQGPLVTVTIQQPEAYVPLGSDLPPPPKSLGKATEVLTKSSYTETTTTRITNNILALPSIAEEEITLMKAGGPLGLSIIGGSDHTCHPFGIIEPGIFISKIVPGGAAAKTERLRVGDRLLKVNTTDVSKATHQEAVMALLAPTYHMVLKVQHEPLPKGWQEIIIHKNTDEKLGMNIKGGTNGLPGNPLNKEDEGVFISHINSEGAVSRDGRLKPGMRIIEVNGTSLLGASHQEAVHAMRNTGDIITLIVCDGYSLLDVESSTLSKEPSISSLKASQSLSSLDREDNPSAAVRVHSLTKDQDVDSHSLSSTASHLSEKDVSFSKLSDLPVMTHSGISSGEKTVDQKVLEVVHAAEQLVKPTSSPLIPPPNKSIPSTKEKKTTTIIMTKHTVSHPQSSTPGATTPFLSSLGYSVSPSPTPTSFPVSSTAGDSELNTSTEDYLTEPTGCYRMSDDTHTISKFPKKTCEKVAVEPEQLTFSEKKEWFEHNSVPGPSTYNQHINILSCTEEKKIEKEQPSLYHLSKVSDMENENLHGHHQYNKNAIIYMDSSNMSDSHTEESRLNLLDKNPLQKTAVVETINIDPLVPSYAERSLGVGLTDEEPDHDSPSSSSPIILEDPLDSEKIEASSGITISLELKREHSDTTENGIEEGSGVVCPLLSHSGGNCKSDSFTTDNLSSNKRKKKRRSRKRSLT